MGDATDKAIRDLIAEKVKAQLSVAIKEDEIEKIVMEEIAQFQTEGSAQRQQLVKWIKEDLNMRIKQVISQELTNPIYVGTTWGDAGQFWKEIIRENVDNLVGAMFVQVLDSAKGNLANYFSEQIRRGY